MSDNIIQFSANKRNPVPALLTPNPQNGELSAVETLELVRTYSSITDPSIRQAALDYLKQISLETTAK